MIRDTFLNRKRARIRGLKRSLNSIFSNPNVRTIKKIFMNKRWSLAMMTRGRWSDIPHMNPVFFKENFRISRKIFFDEKFSRDTKSVSIKKFRRRSFYPYSTLMLNQYLRNVELRYCECCSNIAKCKFNVEKTSQKRLMSVEHMSYRRCISTLIQHWINIYLTYKQCRFRTYYVHFIWLKN